MNRANRFRIHWVAYGAALWALIFALFHMIWATGCYIGLDHEQARKAFVKTPFLVYDLVVAAMCAFAVPVANKHLTKPGLMTIPGKPGDDLAVGTLNNILKQAGLKP
ncbi:MAG TPA: type II toxin-antitoxin system HicA family toxin [Pyrinomonadaceae bacterium]|nr:type II toxin-antitoxin system HicA family toxin [Pyrinomonadaceae bacterium]